MFRREAHARFHLAFLRASLPLLWEGSPARRGSSRGPVCRPCGGLSLLAVALVWEHCYDHHLVPPLPEGRRLPVRLQAALASVFSPVDLFWASLAGCYALVLVRRVPAAPRVEIFPFLRSPDSFRVYHDRRSRLPSRVRMSGVRSSSPPPSDLRSSSPPLRGGTQARRSAGPAGGSLVRTSSTFSRSFQPSLSFTSTPAVGALFYSVASFRRGAHRGPQPRPTLTVGTSSLSTLLCYGVWATLV